MSKKVYSAVLFKDENFVLLTLELPWQRNDAITFFFISRYQEFFFFQKSLKVARTYLYASWLCFDSRFFRMKDSTDFYDFWHT